MVDDLAATTPVALHERADACRLLANTSNTPERQAHWLEQAEHWETLAVQQRPPREPDNLRRLQLHGDSKQPDHSTRRSATRQQGRTASPQSATARDRRSAGLKAEASCSH